MKNLIFILFISLFAVSCCKNDNTPELVRMGVFELESSDAKISIPTKFEFFLSSNISSDAPLKGYVKFFPYDTVLSELVYIDQTYILFDLHSVYHIQITNMDADGTTVTYNKWNGVNCDPVITAYYKRVG